jgi:charged multivesicular body protein 2A
MLVSTHETLEPQHLDEADGRQFSKHQILEWAFGRRMTPAERLRKNQRMLDKAIRELDQQRVKLEKQEKTLVAQIRQSAQKGQMGACKIQAKDLVRTRRLA